MKYNYVFFDVANTLLYKKDLYVTLIKTLEKFDIKIKEDKLVERHKLLSEIVPFPEKTSKEFYQYFNSQLLYLLGIIPTDEILTAIYANCSYLPWDKFEDADILKELNIPLGIISNWDESLHEKLKNFFDLEFGIIACSSVNGMAKPNIEIFKEAILRSKVSLGEILFVGDSIRLDMEPASKIGIKPVLIDRNELHPNFKGIRIKSLREIKKIIND